MKFGTDNVYKDISFKKILRIIYLYLHIHFRKKKRKLIYYSPTNQKTKVDTIKQNIH